MQIHLYLNKTRIAEVFDLKHHGQRQWSFTCRPPIFDAEADYEVAPSGERPMKIMIASLQTEGSLSRIEAVEP